MNNSKANPLRAGRQNADFTSDLPFRLLVDSVRDYAIFLLDPEGHVLTWNAGAEFIKATLRMKFWASTFPSSTFPKRKRAHGRTVNWSLRLRKAGFRMKAGASRKMAAPSGLR